MKIELAGWGAEATKNLTAAYQRFTSPKPKKKKINKNTCNRCGKKVPPRRRYCDKCKIKQRNESQKRWRHGGR